MFVFPDQTKSVSLVISPWKVIVGTVTPAQIVISGTEYTFGIGLVQIINVSGIPGQPFNIG